MFAKIMERININRKDEPVKRVYCIYLTDEQYNIMKIKKVLFLINLMFLCAFGCNKENVTPINPSTDSIHLEVVWHKLFHSDSTTEYFLNSLFFNDYIVL